MGYCPWGCKRVGHELATKHDYAKSIFNSKGYFLTSIIALKIALKKKKLNCFTIRWFPNAKKASSSPKRGVTF